LTLGNFILVFDEEPDFDGEPLPIVEDVGRVYEFKKAG